MTFDIFSLIALGFVSLFSNFLSALAGGGAGLIQLPALLFFGLPFSNALATHKVASVALGIGASIPYFRNRNRNRNINRNLNLSYGLLILLSGIPGVLLGVKTVLIIPSRFSTALLGFLTLIISCYSFNNKKLGRNNIPKTFNFNNIIVSSLGLFIIGFLNGYLSSGTGLFVTMWMITIFNLSFAVSIAYTLIFVGIFWNGVGAFSLGLHGNIAWNCLPVLIIGSLAGGYLGASLSIIKDTKYIKFIFELVCLSVAISLLIKASFLI